MNKSIALPCRANSERGGYLVLTAILILAIIGLAVLIVGTGFLATGKTRLQNIANFASLGALEEFISSARDTTVTSYAQRIDLALNRANAILNENSIAGISGALGELDHDGASGAAGTIYFGEYMVRAPTDSNPCVEYPCFVKSPLTGGPNVNAVQIRMRNQSDNLLSIPFTRALRSEGYAEDHQFNEVTATTTVVPRCTAFVADISSSAGFETHRNLPFPAPGIVPKSELIAETIYGTPPPSFPQTNPCIVGTSRGTGDLPPDFEAGGPCNSSDFAPNPEAAAWPALFVPEYLPGNQFKPRNLGAIAFHENVVRPSGVDFECNNPSAFASVAQIFHDELVTWCSMGMPNPVSGAPYIYNRADAPFPERDNPTFHFQSDFLSSISLFDSVDSPVIVETDFGDSSGNLLVDSLFEGYGSHVGPQPFTRFFLAFNAGIRLLRTQEVAGDTAMLVGFSDQPRLWQRLEPTDLRGLSSLEVLGRLTNLNRRGIQSFDSGTLSYQDVSGEPVPGSASDINAFARGGIPLFPLNNSQNKIDSTNLVGTLNQVIEELAMSCPAGSRKAIILASDGIGTCDNDPADPDCSPLMSTYLASEGRLLNGPSSVINRLIDNQISLSAIIDGRYVRPHFKNVRNTTACPGSVSVHLDPIYRNNPQCYQNPALFSQSVETISDVTTFVSGEPSGAPGAPGSTVPFTRSSDFQGVLNDPDTGVFERPMWVLGALASRSGGVFCPLLNTDNPTRYVDHDDDDSTCTLPTDQASPCILDNQYRIEGQRQEFAIDFRSKAEQAAQCTIAAAGLQPYILTRPLESNL